MIESIQPTGGSPVQSTTSQTGTSSVDYNAFLQLLVAQLKNQDPTEPMGSTEYVAQLATFSNVEQGTKMNERLEYLIQMTSLQQATDLLGKTVTSPDGEITGAVAEVRVLTDGVLAILEGGEQVIVGPGTIISS